MDGCDCSHGGILQVPEVTTHGKQIVLGRAKLGRQLKKIKEMLNYYYNFFIFY